MKGFDPKVSARLREFLQSHAARPGRKVAVFDADGTLWRGDVGDAFYLHQLERKSIPHAPGKNPWDTYFNETQTDNAAVAYGWLAQWNAGVPEKELLHWADAFFKAAWAKHVFPVMRELTGEFHRAGFEVWVVSASIRWIIQAGVKDLGVPAERIIATAVTVEGGVLTDKLAHVVPYRGGKLALIQKIIGVSPLFAAGNTYWDQEMMSSASELALAIHSEAHGEPNYDSEQRLKALAESKKWLTQRL